MTRKTTKMNNTWKRIGVMALSLTLAWSIGPMHTLPDAGAASSACGKGDHGLASELNKGSGVEGRKLQFTDIDFLSQTTGRAAGKGFLIGTSNAGCTWQSIYTGQWQFEQLSFPNNVTGYALAGVKGSSKTYLIQTDDGGSHWKRLDTPGVPTFKHIDFSDTNNGYGYTYNGAYRTTNGGMTWTQLHTPANTRAAAFVTAKLGYAVVVVPEVGYKLEKTLDEGKTWTTVLRVKSDTWNGADLYAHGQQVWAVLYGDAGMSQQSYSLYASGDQGKRWRQVFAQSTAGAGPAPGATMDGKGTGPANPGGHPGNMALIGNQTAYLSAGSPAADQIGIGRSYDAGSTWNNIVVKAEGYSSRISFPAGKTGWLVVTSDNAPAVYETTDGGTTWSPKISF